MNNKLKITEVAVLINKSPQTICMWYQWKRKYPDNEYAKLLPEYEQCGPRKTRYWDREDLCKLIEFSQKLPRGRNGFMGEVTQKYVKKEENNDTKKTNR